MFMICLIQYLNAYSQNNKIEYSSKTYHFALITTVQFVPKNIHIRKSLILSKYYHNKIQNTFEQNQKKQTQLTLIVPPL